MIHESKIHLLHSVVVEAQLPRSALFAGIDPAILASIPSAPNDAAQFLQDIWHLVQLQSAPALITWLRNAHRLCDGRPFYPQILEAVLAELGAAPWPTVQSLRTQQGPNQQQRLNGFGAAPGGNLAKARLPRVLVSEDDAEPTIERALHEFARKLLDFEPISSLIAETNASGFYPDEIEIVSVDDFDFEDASIGFSARIHFAGEQHEDKMWHGDSIMATLDAKVYFDGEEWSIGDDYTLNADVEHDYD